MKKYLYIICLLSVGLPSLAQTSLQEALPLLQKANRTPEQTQQVLTLFRTAQDPNLVFAAGASLVKTPPSPTHEPALLSQLMRQEDPLRAAFAAIILTSMGSVYEELSPLLQEVVQSADPALRAYGAGAYGLLNPSDKTHVSDIVRLYIFDRNFAQRALHFITQNPKEQLGILKKASTHPDDQIRSAAAAWLGALHSPEAVKLLLKMAKTEKSTKVQTQIAMALAANVDTSLEGTLKGLNTNYKKSPATTYALALGFMTGNSVGALKDMLLAGKENQRINALRACAYMASVLSNPDAFAYTSDRTFDIHLLKGLIPQISALASNGSTEEQLYAQNALAQIEKLL